MTTFASRSLEQSKKARPKLATQAFSGFAKAKRQSVFHRNLGGAWGGIDSRYPTGLRKRLWHQIEPKPLKLSYGAGDGKSKGLLRKPLFRCGPLALACCAGKCSRIFSASHPAGFDSRYPTGLRKRLWHQIEPKPLKLSYGAGDGNRTRVISLEGWGSTIELRPQDMVGTTGFEPATSCSQSRRATKLRHVPKVLSS